jgi:alkylation response protein AidB-like acyl-CoA dehydrogenase
MRKSHYPVDVWKAAGELGFGAIYVSEENRAASAWAGWKRR